MANKTKAELQAENAKLLKRIAALERAKKKSAAESTELKRLRGELLDAEQRQAATAEILKVIAASPSDVQPVFDAIATSAMRLFKGQSSAVTRVVGDSVHLAAMTSTSKAGNEALEKLFPTPLSSPLSLHSRVARTGKPAVRVDAENDPEMSARGREMARARGYRSDLVVPMMRDGTAIGAISVTRREPGEFSEEQVNLLETFAAQAVIAIENVRLFTETKESLERQTATAEILRVIGGSMTDTQPVFDAIVKNCSTLFEGGRVVLWLIDEDRLHPRASTGTRSDPMPIDRESAIGACVLDAKLIHLPDLESAVGEYPRLTQLGLKFGYRSGIYAPLMRAGRAIGGLSVLRLESGAFDEKEMALLGTFADQAVIAIENVRLFDETREGLERQTATAEILKVIAGSPSDVQPVFDVIADSAMRLFRGQSAIVTRLSGDMLQLAAMTSTSEEGNESVRQSYPRPLLSPSLNTTVARSGRPAFHTDIENDPVASPEMKARARARGIRSNLIVPMLREGQAIGTISVTRAEPGTFTPHQIHLLETFADQAVIAIENVRLFNETKEALERQTATAEILKVIASSPSDVQPVFDVIAERSMRLCGCQTAAVTRLVGEMLHLAAMTATSEEGNEAVRKSFPRPLSSPSLTGAVARSGRAAFQTDIENDPTASPELKARFRARGTRSNLIVPMLREGQAVGTISVSRAEPGTFTPHQIHLLETFADQAVIAIENVRMFNETKESLERQTATAEILKVISNSPTNVQPVLDAIVNSAARLFEPCRAVIVMRDGNLLQLSARAGSNWAMDGGMSAVDRIYPIAFDPERSNSARAIMERRIIEVPDAEAPGVSETAKDIARAGKYRSATTVPLLREGEGIGTIALVHPEAGFRLTEKQLALVQTFADQAVIAIENVRLFNETKEALERQTATAEILKVISSSPTDVQPVFDAIVESGARLFDPCNATITMLEGGSMHWYATAGAGSTPEYLERLKGVYPLPFDPDRSPSSRAIAERRIVEVMDAAAPGSPVFTAQAGKAFGFRTGVFVPLIRDGAGIGTIILTHPEPGFKLTDNQLALVQTFADQAVIAIENVRLFNETKESLERQTATAEILKVMSSSPTDTQPVFDAIVKSAARLFSRNARIRLVAGDRLHLVARSDTSPSGFVDAPFLPLDRNNIPGRVILDRKAFQISDTRAPDATEFESSHFKRLGQRAISTAPLIRENTVVGAIGVTSPEPGSLSDKEMALLQTFADQAVIAIENVRLFNETREALERQTATAEILKVISSSPTDTQPVFEAIVDSAARLFSRKARIRLVEGGRLHLRARSDRDSSNVVHQAVVPIDRESIFGRAFLDRKMLQVADTQASDAPAAALARIEKSGNRALAAAPLVRDDTIVGVIGVFAPEPGALSDKEMALLQTFADQAVIAIENVRLFKELESRTAALSQSVGQLTALGEVGQAISSTLDLETVLKTIVSRALQLTGLDGGSMYEYDERAGVFRMQTSENMAEELQQVTRNTPIRLGDGAVGRTGVTREPVQVPDTLDDSYQSARKELLIRSGYRAVLAVPLLREDNLLGALLVTRKTPGPFAPEVVDLLKTFATQSAMAIQNARLFREIAEKGKQLEIASHHKSDFLASMSHELRTPLNAILGFNELILAEIYGTVPEEMKEPLTDIQTSGKHLLRLINNVLDLAKIEAGRMELALADYSVHDTVESVRSTLRPLAAEKGLEFLATVPDEIPIAYGDFGRITQCLMNLAGNSLKFTKEGKVEIVVALNGETLVYRVNDTGIGIPPDKIASLFTEFKQTDATIASEYGGTGLGLSISKKFIEMHGGRIWIESELGKGSSFIFEVPLRVEGITTAGAGS